MNSNYKQNYYQENKIVTFPLSIHFYDELRKRSVYYDMSVNSYTKTLVTNQLSGETFKILNKESQKYLDEYIRISRGIANNINQIAYNTNINETIDVNILISSLRHYEEEFKNLLIKL